MNLPNAVALLFHEGKHNPLVKIMIRRVRPLALGIVLFQVLMSAFSLATVYFASVTKSLLGVGLLMALLMFLIGLGMLVVQCLGPIYYADWSYRRTWQGDESLRLTRFTFRERMMGILAPVLILVVAFFTPSLVLQPLINLLQAAMQAGNPGAEFLYGNTLPTRLLFVLSVEAQTLVYCSLYSFTVALVVMRRLVARNAASTSKARSLWYMIMPYLLCVGFVILWSIPRTCTMSVPMMLQIFAQGAMKKGTAAPALVSGLSSDGFRIALGAAGLAIDVCFVFLAWFVYQRKLTVTLMEAKGVLFGAGDQDCEGDVHAPDPAAS
ncbi:hypothetical protein IT570_01295 [Candidatus Sumerlaeota bacterium]|nr:hypothetical protein [Candidatus Sumerlaeota bacterium]